MNIFAAAVSKPLPEPAPPADFNIKLSQLPPTRATALTRAVHQGQLDGYYCLGELWVRRADADDLLPAGHCSYDETDACCFIPD
jgi:hypothetical protein